MTDILKVVIEYCDQYVDDLNLEELKVSDFPLYAYKMWGYLRAALPFLIIRKICRPIFRYIHGTKAEEPGIHL